MLFVEDFRFRPLEGAAFPLHADVVNWRMHTTLGVAIAVGYEVDLQNTGVQQHRGLCRTTMCN